MEPGTDSPVEDHDTSDDEVPKGYRRKCLPPEMPISIHSFHSELGDKQHAPTQPNSKHRTRQLIHGNVRCVAYPIRNVVPSRPRPVTRRHRVHIFVAPFARRCISRRFRLQSPRRQAQEGRKPCVGHDGGSSERSDRYPLKSRRWRLFNGAHPAAQKITRQMSSIIAVIRGNRRGYL